MKNLRALICIFFLSLYALLISEEPASNATLTPPTSMLHRTLELAQGYQVFKENFFPKNEQKFIELVNKGQAPRILFIGCSDSRVAPEMILQAQPGQLFVIRSAGNFVPSFNPDIPWDGIAATIEYAIKELGIQEIVVCGHSHCGAINSLFTPEEDLPKMISNWLQFGKPAKELVLKEVGDKGDLKEKQYLAGHLSVIFQLKNLISYPFIQERLNEGKLTLHGWYFYIESGSLEYFDPKTANFYPIKSYSRHLK